MQIVKRSDLSYPSVRATITQYESGGMEAIRPAPRGRPLGQGRDLNPDQEQHILHILQSKLPKQVNLEHNAWSRPAVACLIKREFNIHLTPRGAGNYMARWGIVPASRTKRDAQTQPLPDAKKSTESVTRPPDAANQEGIHDAESRPTLIPEAPSRQAWGPQTTRQGNPSQTIAGQIARRLRRDIITHRFQPGERLTFHKLSRHYQAGSSPLREALFQVMGEGLVLSEEHRGFVVAPINIDEMLDISTLRAQFESIALRLSIQNGDNNWEARVISATHLLKKATAHALAANENEQSHAIEEWETRHRQLHCALCSACGSPWLLHFIDILYEHLERYRRYFWHYAVRAHGADHEHEQITKAALARDAELGVRLLHGHFQSQAELSLLADKESASPNHTEPRNHDHTPP